MKQFVNKNKLVFFLFFMLMTVSPVLLKAQGEDGETVNKKRGAKVEKTVKDQLKIDTRDRLIFQITHDNWMNKPDSVKVKWFNRGFSGYLQYDQPLFKSKNVSVAPGIGIASHNVYFNSRIEKNDTATYFQPLADSITYSKNKLNTTYADIPLELRFRTNPNKFNKTWKLALGIKVGYLLSATHKYRGKNYGILGNRPLDEEIKVKDKFVPNMNKLRYGTMVRLGYSNFNIFAFYSLSTLFDTNKGPGIHPFSVGFSFNSF